MQTFHHLSAQYANDGGIANVFSAKVADYIASRPDYPVALFETLDSLLEGTSHNARIADVGAGTGLLTRDLLKRGHEVIAVEPNQSMRDAADHFLRTHPNYSSAHGSAEAMPLESQSIDLMTAATAFHWFDIPRAKAECLRVLKPNGFVALIWNDRVFGDPFHRSFDAIATEFGGQKRSALLAHEGWEKSPEFFGNTTAVRHSWPHQHSLDENGVASLLFSRSYIPARESAEGQRVIKAVREAFNRHQESGRVVVRYNTIAHIGRPS